MSGWDSSKRKKILVLDASPSGHDGCTMLLTENFLKGFSEVCDIETETVKLDELDIKPCRGCLSCWGATGGECVLRGDDIAEVKRKIECSDVFIESFPLYFFGMPGTLKVFTDRMLGMMSPYRGQVPPTDGSSFHGVFKPQEDRRFVIVSSCAYTDADKVYAPLIAQFDCICGRNNYTPIFCPQLQTLSKLDYAGAERRLSKHMEKYIAAGREFAINGALSQETVENLKRPPFGNETYKVLIDAFWNGFKDRK